MLDKIIGILENQEELLVFDKFDEQVAWIIGNCIREKIAESSGSAAVDITCANLCLFS